MIIVSAEGLLTSATVIPALNLTHPHHHPQQQPRHRTQTRGMGRKCSASAFSKSRPPTRKNHKKCHWRMRGKNHAMVGRHGHLGSVAGPRREEERLEREYLLARVEGKLEEGGKWDVRVRYLGW